MLMKIFYFVTLWVLIASCVALVMMGEHDAALAIGFVLAYWCYLFTMLND